ncbi:MAG: arginine--tRNA ligase [Planctomycetes bacterium]|nr:arginine--tRNA ligase [Planctomycetota bacterium]MBU4399603.1 arginine--tRNA ligase [Planctomycetota bacterium]MCG2685305.1 arginine--tRNA ligase [Planctomycetales bacterium]
MSILSELKERFRKALLGMVDDPADLLELVRRGQDPKFGDYQANMAMPLSKRLGRPPREIAAEIVQRIEVADICREPEIAGPGFINLRLKEQWLAEELSAAVLGPRLGVAPVTKPRTFVVDYSAPNVAKPMHVGHIRSTVIGDALCRVLRFLGHRAISDNHIGDWGTQFGMILYGYKHFLDAEAYRQNPVEELARLYRKVRSLMDEQPKINLAVLTETAKLHAGDVENRRLWEEFLPHCEDEIDRVYRRLDVKFDHTLGESFYHSRLGEIVDDLIKRGVACESEGAVCVFLDVAAVLVPMIVRKRDGAYLYATTDLATLRYRMETWRPDAILYVVDYRQSLHFQQLFAVAGMLGYDNVELQHVSFGTVLGSDGRPFKTRSGDTVGLEGLLDEAVRRALQIVSAGDDAKPDGPELSAERRRQVAETVGIAALKYADLAQNRTSDYVFGYDKMLAMTGNTATYMQYAYARVRSIFAKGNVDVDALCNSGAPILLDSPAERALALELLRFSEALDLTVADYRPNQLTAYLFDLANRYSTFFEQCHVLRAETDELRQSRLLLCDLTARTIQKGLELLGISVVERM